MKIPLSVTEARGLIEDYRVRELDLLDFQHMQQQKMRTLQQKAEITLGQMNDEIDMLSSEIAQVRNLLETEVKRRKLAESEVQKQDEVGTSLRRELRKAQEDVRKGETAIARGNAERERLDHILDKVGSGALEELESSCHEAEEMRFRAEGELSKIREKLNWQASVRMDDRVAVSSVEEELHAVRVSKRKLDKRTMELEDTLQKVARQLRHKKREALDVRKRVDALTERNFMQQQLLHNGILDASVSLARSIKDRKQDTTGRGEECVHPCAPSTGQKGQQDRRPIWPCIGTRTRTGSHPRDWGSSAESRKGGSYARSPRRQRHVQAIRSKIEFLEGAN